MPRSHSPERDAILTPGNRLAMNTALKREASRAAHHDTTNWLIARADSALYQANNGNRNCVGAA